MDSRISGYRILFFAIVFSLAWHIFWLSIVNVVVAPSIKSQAEFSRVTFLGPILSGVSMEVTTGSVDRTFLENRYSEYVKRSIGPKINISSAGGSNASDGKYLIDAPAGRVTDERMPNYIDEAIDSKRVEPD